MPDSTKKIGEAPIQRKLTSKESVEFFTNLNVLFCRLDENIPDCHRNSCVNLIEKYFYILKSQIQFLDPKNEFHQLAIDALLKIYSIEDIDLRMNAKNLLNEYIAQISPENFSKIINVYISTFNDFYQKNTSLFNKGNTNNNPLKDIMNSLHSSMRQYIKSDNTIKKVWAIQIQEFIKHSQNIANHTRNDRLHRSIITVKSALANMFPEFIDSTLDEYLVIAADNTQKPNGLKTVFASLNTQFIIPEGIAQAATHLAKGVIKANIRSGTTPGIINARNQKLVDLLKLLSIYPIDYVRKQLAISLGYFDNIVFLNDTVGSILKELLSDESTHVKEAAANSLARWSTTINIATRKTSTTLDTADSAHGTGAPSIQSETSIPSETSSTSALTLT